MFVMFRKPSVNLTFNFAFFLALGCLTTVSSQCKINNDCKNGYCRSGMCICNRGWWGSLCEFCRLRLSADSGIITDGDGMYSASSKCSWLIESKSPNSTIHLDFEEFATECNWDHLYIYDGKSIKSPLIGVISGLIKDDSKPRYIDGQVLKLQANSGAAFLYFYSDRHYFENGFRIKYSVSRDCSTKCSFHGHCDKDQNCICDKGWAGPTCNMQTCIEECIHGYCDNTTGLCVCDPGVYGSSCNISGDRALWVQHSSKGQNVIQGRSSHASALLGEYMWVFGGYSFNTAPFDDLIRYHIPSDSWEVVFTSVNCSEAPSRRYAHTMIAYNTSLYVFGGRINQQATNELWLFDTQTLCWMLLPSLGDSPFAVAGHTATLVNSKMIVLFGYGPLRGYTDKVQEYNLDTGRWSVHRVPTDIIRPLYGHSTAYHPIHNLLYVHGGVYESSELAKDLTSYNPVTRKWKALKASNVPRFHHSAVFLGDVMLVFGGNSHNGTLGAQSNQPCFATDFVAYDIACDEWKIVPYSGNLKSSGRYGHSSMLVNRSMYVFGGFQGVLLNDVLSFTPGPCGLIKDKSTCQMSFNSSDCVWSDFSSTCLGPERCIRPQITAEDKCRELTQSCKRCTSAMQGCSWCDGICVKGDCPGSKGRIDSPGKCPKGKVKTCQGKCKELDCFNLSTCGDCVAKVSCMWCESQKQCVAPNAYPVSFPYGQCLSWVQSQCSGVRCSELKTCDDCHTLPGCGWCDDGSGTGLGQCIDGGDNGPFTTSPNASASQCPADRWYFIECPDCQCNGHSRCINRNICEKCKNNTSGHRCEVCAVGHYGDAKNGGTCKACECNGHADTCDHETGKCECLAHWVTGDHCESCSDETDIVGNATNGGHCYNRLKSGFQFTFNVSKNKTSIAFINIPARDDEDVEVEVKITTEGTSALLNLSVSSELFREEALFSYERIGHFHETFSHGVFRFGGDDRLAFRVIVFNIKEFTTLQISFTQKQKFLILSFFITFFACFFSLLFVVGLAWKIKVRYSTYMMARHRVEEMKVMASRPFAKVSLAVTDPVQERLSKQPSHAIAVQPMESHRAAVGVFMMRLPGGRDGYTPIGQTGICCATTLSTYGDSTFHNHPLSITRRTAVKRSSMVRVLCT
ncbi:unnamed protein product [Porites lobata]|uniref:Attractin n=1 Tax=Porites lobata TaxID=104759 RepID=A0ABN8MQY9_9CNID|nr:unnamed protein product [Porites lobata]